MRDASSRQHSPFDQSDYRKNWYNPLLLGIAARFIAGMAFGMAHLTVTVHGSDIASARMRQVISYAMATVMAVSMLYYSILMQAFTSFEGEYNGFGLELVTIGALVLLLGPFCITETTLYYLVRGQAARAQKEFAQIYGGRELSGRKMAKFREVQAKVRQDNSRNRFVGDNSRRLCIVLSARLLHLFSLNLPLIMCLMEGTKAIATRVHPYDNLILTELCVTRVVVGSIVLAAAAHLGREKFMYISVIAFATFIGSILGIPKVHLGHPLFVYAVVTAFMYLSFGLDYYQQKLAMETFSPSKKAWSLATIGILEQFVHVALIAAFITAQRSHFIFGIGIVAVLLSSYLLASGMYTRDSSTQKNTNGVNEAK